MIDLDLKPMKFKILAVLCGVLFSLDLLAQNFSFKPKWNVGESYTVHMTTEEHETDKGVETKDTAFDIDAKLKVLKETKEHYYLRMKYKNVALRPVLEAFNNMSEELEGFSDVNLKFQVSKENGAFELSNYDEVKRFMDDNFDQIKMLAEGEYEGGGEEVEVYLKPVRKMFESKENVEAYMGTEMALLLFHFGKVYEKGDTLTIEESAPNPMRPQDTVSSTSTTWIEGKTQNGGTLIKVHEELDMSQFIAMMKSFMTAFADASGATDSAKNAMNEALEKLQMDMITDTSIEVEKKTNWAKKVVRKTVLTYVEPEGTSVRTVTMTMELK